MPEVSDYFEARFNDNLDRDENEVLMRDRTLCYAIDRSSGIPLQRLSKEIGLARGVFRIIAELTEESGIG